MQTMLKAFPMTLTQEITQLTKVIELESVEQDMICYTVLLNKEQLSIPERIHIHFPRKKIEFECTQLQKSILYCFYTRHANGYIREHCLKEILAHLEEWMIPYIVRLSGEYIYEIINIIYRHRLRIEEKNLAHFLIENEAFYHKTTERIKSYWNCYYRWKSFKFDEYIGYDIIDFYSSAIETNIRLNTA